jgi:ureidoacrylate peracid hydrolase
MVRLQAKPEPIDIDLERTAILVVDMQNSFVAKGGMFDLADFDIAGSAPVIEVNRRLLAASRAAAVKVIYLVIAFKPDLSDAGDPSSPAYHKELALRMMRSRPELTGKLLIDGGWDAAIDEALAPQPGEAVIRKTRYDGFCRTELDAVLRAGNIRYLLFTGRRHQCLRREHGAPCLLQRVLADPRRGRDEQFRAGFQPAGHAVEFRAHARLGDPVRRGDRGP